MAETFIHPAAVVDPKAQIGAGVHIEPFAVVEGGAVIGDGTWIGPSARITQFARIGKECFIHQGAAIGSPPQDLKFGGEHTELVIGDRTTLREYTTLNRGTTHGGGRTVVGSDCLLMAYAHVAHDCQIGDNVILANAVNMGGHVHIDSFANISGLVAIHQFTRIGGYSYIGGLSRISQDVPPYALINGIPPEYFGPNVIGLRRKGFSGDQINNIKKALGIIYDNSLNLKQALDKLRSSMEPTPEVEVILQFITASERGISGR